MDTSVLQPVHPVHPVHPAELLPWTMMTTTSFLPRPPSYAVVQEHSLQEHLLTIVPASLQGTQGVLDLIATFVGVGYRWCRVLGQWKDAYVNRDRDLYFLFSILSRRLPLPTSMEELRCSHRDPPSHQTLIEAGTRFLPLDSSGLYYTRTGHLGTLTDLQRLTRVVRCGGYVTRRQPTLPAMGHHAIITTRPQWSYPSSVVRIHPDQLPYVDQDRAWDTVILDHLQPTPASVCVSYPDARHVSGHIAPLWVRIEQVFGRRKQTIIWTETSLSEPCLLEYMYLLQTTYQQCRFISIQYTLPRSVVRRVAETFVLEGIVTN